MDTMYNPQAGSPETELASSITKEDTEIEVKDGSILPGAPNILTMTSRDKFESIIYQKKEGNMLLDVSRGVEGEPQDWEAEETISRLFTAKDLLTVQDWISSIIVNTSYGVDLGGVMKTYTTPAPVKKELAITSYSSEVTDLEWTPIEQTYSTKEEKVGLSYSSEVTDLEWTPIEQTYSTKEEKVGLSYKSEITELDLSEV